MTGRHGGNQGGRPATVHARTNPLYRVWMSMRQRCEAKWHKFYSHYGARGISVCPEWYVYEVFEADMKATYQPGLTLERRRNNEGYSKDNCYWATWKQQARNRRGNKTIETPKGCMLLCEAAEISGLTVQTLHYRVKAGWPANRMFDKPDKTRRISV